MKAEGTVMNIWQINELPVNKLSGLPTPVAVAEAQAEITGKIMKQEGIKEVVEWIKKYEDTTVLIDDEDNPVASYFFEEGDLKAQLKKWGIKL